MLRPMTWSGRVLLALHCALWGCLVAACGGRTPLNDTVDADVLVRPMPGVEFCSGMDEDFDGEVDEDYRDELGRYVALDHCGGCGNACVPTGSELATECLVLAEAAVCVATDCVEGFAPSETGRCVPLYERLCLPCTEDEDCGDVPTGTCADIGGESRCAIGCDFGCPAGFSCVDDVCAPSGGSCSCEAGEVFELACALEDPEGLRCVGSAQCRDGALSVCLEPAEVCDEVDNDCDGELDEGFRDRRGAYILDIHNCGECGVDCTTSSVPEGDLECGGDPFAPSCVLHCPDTDDGIGPGDRIDADRDIATGCECTVTALADVPGPVLAVGEALDVNCDGADGIVVESFYVATDGDDDGPGSPTRPLRTLSIAVERAVESVGTEDPRLHIFVASGRYVETVELADGVQIHGGYRRDFLALDPNGFLVTLLAPADAETPGGAALVADGAGATPTVVEWMAIRGRDAILPSAATFGIVLDDPGPRLALRDVDVRSGVAGAGMDGDDGEAGVPFTSAAEVGSPPRGAEETGDHSCVRGEDNVVAGGRGGRSVCDDGTTVAGGVGGSPTCPMFANVQPPGAQGQAAGPVTGGGGGRGGQDSQGPIMGSSCMLPVCCGLADFSVPTTFEGPQSGVSGAEGGSGTGGRGCLDALGFFRGDLWLPDVATGGTFGSAGSGGGGGGAGGGAEMQWFDGVCEFPDGLGGGGGGGGAGGCGGSEGADGSSGAPSVAILVRYSGSPSAVPTFLRVVLAPRDGGRGGDGGGGGEGARGGAGGFGGELAREDRSTPTLAGPFPGGRGGPGGAGGSGGGGGGGCGGGSVGVWLTGVDREPAGVSAWRTDNTFTLGRGGRAGQGGGGAAPGADGMEGGMLDVVVR